MHTATYAHYYVLSGAMGGGKSTILTQLRARGIDCIPEPARAILAEQRLIKAAGVPEQNAELFCQLMLSRAMYTYTAHRAVTTPILFDRGIPDLIAYAQLFGLDTTVYVNAANAFPYNPTVFFFPAWAEIYTTDAERKMSFLDAQAFGQMVHSVYEQLGYQLLDVPCVSPTERVQFIVDHITTDRATPPRQSRVIFMCGPAGAGKSTVAKQLEQQGMARLSFDEESFRRGVRTHPLTQETYAEIEQALLTRLLGLVRQKQAVVLDYSFWSRAMRDRYKALLAPLGIVPEIIYVMTPKAVVLQRLQRRTGAAPHEIKLSAENAARYYEQFEAPTADEGQITVVSGG